MTNWWDNFYNLTTADLFLQRDKDTSDALSAFLIQQLHLQEGQILFDQCCGIGTVSMPLTQNGIEVIGVDISRPFIQRAQQLSTTTPNCRYEYGDAFEFLPSKACHAAINWYGSFGYAEEDSQNIKMLQRAYESLLPGGYFALDFMNTYGILMHFKAQMIRKNDRYEIVRNCRLDYQKGRIEQDWNYYDKGQLVETQHSSVKLYLPHQLETMLRACGFVNLQLFGDIQGNPMSASCPRCILIGQKPETC